jgi:MEMO1 family protein
MVQLSIRRAAVAGRFYPGDAKALSSVIEEIYNHEKSKFDITLSEKSILGAIVPHAGYIFSAYQAVYFFNLLENSATRIDTFVIINPNHTGFGEKISMDSHQFWNTPLGNVEQDVDFIFDLGFPLSDIAHREEHSGEVMLPLLQYFVPYEFKIVMITLSQQNDANAKEIAGRIKETSEKLNRNIMIIASSDFTHFENAETGKKCDDIILEQIEKQKTSSVYNVVKENHLSVCGYGPIMCLMEYSALCGKYSTKILARGHSGQVRQSEKVVDYITILFTKD